MRNGTIKPLGAFNFPGFHKILEFVSNGTEASKSVAVNGDTDKDFIILVRNTDTTDNITMRLNNDSGANYGWQKLENDAGSISAGRSTGQTFFYIGLPKGFSFLSLATPQNFIKTLNSLPSSFNTGTTIRMVQPSGIVYNSSSNIVTLDFLMDSGNFNIGSEIAVFARRTT